MSSFFQLLEIAFAMEFAKVSAAIGGKAFPTCLHCSPLLPRNSTESGNVWILAASRTVSCLSSQGWIGNALCPGTRVQLA